MLDFLVPMDSIQWLLANFATTSIHGFKYMDFMHHSNLLRSCSVEASKQGESLVWTTPKGSNMT